MRVLLIHQNFPGQFKHLGPALVARGDHVVALTPKVKERTEWRGITVEPYAIKRGNGQNVHPWVTDFETKVIRAEACYNGAVALKQSGFEPDVILTHHGWGESLFLKDVWPNARMGLYCELYHLADYPFVGFDPEFDQGLNDTDPIRCDCDCATSIMICILILPMQGLAQPNFRQIHSPPHFAIKSV